MQTAAGEIGAPQPAAGGSVQPVAAAGATTCVELRRRRRKEREKVNLKKKKESYRDRAVSIRN